ncbi:hypothetical protein [Spirosoma fluviale]|uniref:Por secretion system C-terminal sorting domain-containing protein n=1 Tax=Spirosoma fluviale TaxID=1597977 RepID=A0A286GBV8_9BACT|nr:hypothetical protein [Spirosoma fluviale]SOD93007.1 hypothetical protein SAMN06269250_4305 [Spirosoma fluviale]
MNNSLTSAFAKTVAALFFSATPLLANPTNPTKPASFDASVYITKTNKIKLAVDKTPVESVSIRLREVGQSNYLFTQQVGKRQTQARLQLNVDDLPGGTYELEISSASGASIVKQVQLGTATPVAAPQRLVAIN